MREEKEILENMVLTLLAENRELKQQQGEYLIRYHAQNLAFLKEVRAEAEKEIVLLKHDLEQVRSVINRQKDADEIMWSDAMDIVLLTLDQIRNKFNWLEGHVEDRGESMLDLTGVDYKCIVQIIESVEAYREKDFEGLEYGDAIPEEEDMRRYDEFI